MVPPDAFDELFLTELLLIRESKLCRVKIIRRKHDEVGNPVGSYNNNPILNT
jgi:hypothetical protein